MSNLSVKLMWLLFIKVRLEAVLLFSNGITARISFRYFWNAVTLRDLIRLSCSLDSVGMVLTCCFLLNVSLQYMNEFIYTPDIRICVLRDMRSFQLVPCVYAPVPRRPLALLFGLLSVQSGNLLSTKTSFRNEFRVLMDFCFVIRA